MATRIALHGFALLVVLAVAATAHAADFDASDTLSAIDQASAQTGVSWTWLYATVGCETGHTFSPYAIGDHGTSLGAAQLHRGGNALPAFFAAGYTDPMNPYESVEFLARALRGDFPGLGAHTWSCA